MACVTKHSPILTSELLLVEVRGRVGCEPTELEFHQIMWPEQDFKGQYQLLASKDTDILMFGIDKYSDKV